MKKRWLKIGLGLALIGVSIVGLQAVVVINDPETPFKGKTSTQVGDLITQSASELLQSAADAFLLLNEVEIAGRSGLNVNAALQRADMAAARIERTLSIFREIILMGRESGYEPRRISKLKNFSYSQFAQENGLSEEAMNEVSAFLGRGNVLGFYRRHVRNLQQLLDTLQGIRGELLGGRVPENRRLWSLLQQYNSTLIFGNYASMVFYRI